MIKKTLFEEYEIKQLRKIDEYKKIEFLISNDRFEEADRIIQKIIENSKSPPTTLKRLNESLIQYMQNPDDILKKYMLSQISQEISAISKNLNPKGPISLMVMRRLNEQKLEILKDAKSFKDEEQGKILHDYFSFLDSKAKLILSKLEKDKEGQKELGDVTLSEIADDANKKASDIYRSLSPDIAFEKETLECIIDHDDLTALKFLVKKDMFEAAQSFCTEKLKNTTLNKEFYDEFLKSTEDHIKQPSPITKRLLESKIDMHKSKVAKQIDPNVPVSVFVVRQIGKQKQLLNKVARTLSDESSKQVITDHLHFLDHTVKNMIARAEHSKNDVDKFLDISFASIAHRVNAEFNNIKLPELVLANESMQNLKEVMKLVAQDKENLKGSELDKVSKVATGVKTGHIDASAILLEAKAMNVSMSKSDANSIVSQYSGKEPKHSLIFGLKKMFGKESPASKVFKKYLTSTQSRRAL